SCSRNWTRQNYTLRFFSKHFWLVSRLLIKDLLVLSRIPFSSLIPITVVN
ncbi:unnamed protein product, partial [Musa hybrid cultivar]